MVLTDPLIITIPCRTTAVKTMIQKMRAQFGKVCFVGDGSTDLDTQEAVELFIGFGGVIRRKKSRKLPCLHL